MTPTLSAEGLFKSYRGRTVVNDVALTVSSGEVVGLLGPNGAGKTTTFDLMVGLARAERGDIRLDGGDIKTLPMHKRAQLGIGYLPQEPSVFRKLSAGDNIMAVLQTRADLGAAARRAQLEELLGRFNLSARRATLGASLSGGERRRVEIARALALQPRFLLLDEPFSGIDPIAVGDIQQIIRDLRGRGIGILITDHNVRETLSICDRAYVLSEGRVLACGAPEEILACDAVRDAYLGDDFRY